MTNRYNSLVALGCITTQCFKLTRLSQLSRQAFLHGPVVAMRFQTGSIERFDPGAEGRHLQSDLQIAAHSLGCRLPARNHPNPPWSLQIVFLCSYLKFRFICGDTCTSFERMNPMLCFIDVDKKAAFVDFNESEYQFMFRELGFLSHSGASGRIAHLLTLLRKKSISFGKTGRPKTTMTAIWTLNC